MIFAKPKNYNQVNLDLLLERSQKSLKEDMLVGRFANKARGSLT